MPSPPGPPGRRQWRRSGAGTGALSAAEALPHGGGRRPGPRTHGQGPGGRLPCPGLHQLTLPTRPPLWGLSALGGPVLTPCSGWPLGLLPPGTQTVPVSATPTPRLTGGLSCPSRSWLPAPGGEPPQPTGRCWRAGHSPSAAGGARGRGAPSPEAGASLQPDHHHHAPPDGIQRQPRPRLSAVPPEQAAQSGPQNPLLTGPWEAVLRRQWQNERNVSAPWTCPQFLPRLLWHSLHPTRVVIPFLSPQHPRSLPPEHPPGTSPHRPHRELEGWAGGPGTSHRPPDALASLVEAQSPPGLEILVRKRTAGRTSREAEVRRALGGQAWVL